MKKLALRIIIIFQLLSCILLSQEKINISKPKHKRASEAYGYLLGQELTLTYYQSIIPSLSSNCNLAQLNFNSTFGNAKIEIEEYLKAYLGEEKFTEYVNHLNGEAVKMNNSKKVDEASVINYINEVEERAKGKIKTPVLETLLSFQFKENPIDEFVYGFTKVINTKNYPKTNNIDWVIKIPISWKEVESERSNIITTFKSDYGDGNQSIMLIVNDFEEINGKPPTQKEIEEIISEVEMRKLFSNKEIKFVSFKKMKIDNNQGGMIETEAIMERLDMKLKIRTLSFVFIKHTRMYIIQCLINATNINEDLSFEMKKHINLFKLVVNSTFVND